MNILVIEDRGSVSSYLEEALRSEGYKVFSAFNILDAQSFWENERIDCIIADTNMSPEGLGLEEIQESKSGLLSGWIWLKNHVFRECPQMRGRTIVYSDYLEQLARNVPPDGLQGVYLLSKRGSTSPAAELLKKTERIARDVERSA